MATIVVDELITKLEYQHDDATLKQAEASVKALETANKAAAAEADNLSAEQRKLAEQTDALTRAQLDLAEQIADSQRKTDSLADEQRKLRVAVKQSGKATDEQTARMKALDAELQHSKAQTKALREESARLGREKQKVGQEARKLQRSQSDVAKQSRRAADEQRKLKDAMRGAADRAREESGALDKLADQIKGVASGQIAADAVRAVGTAIYGLGESVITTGANFEGLRARLKTVEGSSEGAAKAFALIQDFTKTTPFQLEEVTTAFVRLKSLGLDASRESMTAFGNIAAAQGKSIIDFIEAVADASTGEFERLKEFGIKASKQGEQVTFTFKGQQTVVANNARAIQDFLKGIGQTDFAGAMSDQMATTTGAISNFKDTVAQMLDSVARQGPLEEFNKLLGVLSASIGGDNGLGKMLADVLTISLRTVRELFEKIPQDDVIAFFQQLVTAIGMMAEVLVEATTSQGGLTSDMYGLLTMLLEVFNAVYGLVKRLDEIKSRFDDLPGPLDLVSKAIEFLLWGMEQLADMLIKLIDLIMPAIDAFGSFAGAVADTFASSTLDNIEGFFAGIGSAAKDLAVDLGIVSKAFVGLADDASAADNALSNLYAKMSTQQLTQRAQEGDIRARRELEGRTAENTKREQQAEESAARDKQQAEQRKKQAAKFERFEGERIKDASDNALRALMRDGQVPEKLRDRAEKELDRRERAADKRGKAGASKAKKEEEKERKRLYDSLLTADIQKQIDKLAEQAGQRESARALQRGATREQANEAEIQQRTAVQQRLTQQFQDTGRLPPGIAMDLAQAAALPNIEEVGGRLAPPVITVNNTRVEVSGNTFTAVVEVAGGVAATPGQVADAVVSRAQVVTFNDLGMAIMNNLTQER